MALSTSKEVPKDAIALNEVEAVNYVWDIIDNWETYSDTWALRYSSGILGGVTALSSILINKHYRRKLKLGSYGHFSSFIPTVLLPTMFTLLFHRHIISTNLLLKRDTTCSICYEIKSTAIQVGLGVAYPMVLAPTAGFMFAHRYDTMRIPSLVEKPKELFLVLKKITKPLHATLIFATALHVLMSSILTYVQMKNIGSVQRKLKEIERKIDEDLGYETNN